VLWVVAVCELFGMNNRRPTRATVSFERFVARGGRVGPHRHGWGVGYHDGSDALVVREQAAAFDSAHAHFLETHAPPAKILLAHVRLATFGAVGLSNTQPFARELGGRVHLFAHNGHVPTVASDPRFAIDGYRPVGDTDSERAFCALLTRLAPLWRSGLPALARRQDVVARFAMDLRELGPANFLYTDGDALYAHADRRTQADGQIVAPGLHLLERRCSCDHDADGDAPRSQRIVLVASRPLGDERWRPLPRGTLAVVRNGHPELVPIDSVDRHGAEARVALGTPQPLA
jgi:glutamine amidotransferase